MLVPDQTMTSGPGMRPNTPLVAEHEASVTDVEPVGTEMSVIVMKCPWLPLLLMTILMLLQDLVHGIAFLRISTTLLFPTIHTCVN